MNPIYLAKYALADEIMKDIKDLTGHTFLARFAHAAENFWA